MNEKEFEKLLERINKEYLFSQKILKEEETREEIYNNFTKTLGRLLVETSDKRRLAREFYSSKPFFFDEAENFWIWEEDEKTARWRIIDEYDILAFLDRLSLINIIKTQEKTEIINAFKVIGRQKKPLPLGKRMIQIGKEIFNLETVEIKDEEKLMSIGTEKLRFKATSEYFCTSPIPHKLGKTEDTPILDKLFYDWVGEKRKLLYELLAFSMLPDYTFERIFCLYGAGSNGKSSFLSILRRFLGDYNVCSSNLTNLLKNRFETSKLYNKLVCIIPETNIESIENTALIKSLVSGKDLISIEFKNKGLINIVNYAKLIMSTNNLPETEDKTEGFYRRWIIIDFPNKFENDGVDVLSNIPEEEFENLALKCLNILGELLKTRRFSYEGTIEDKQKKYEEKSNPFDKFFNSFVEEDFNSFISVSEFSIKLNEWLKENRFRMISDITINKLMKNRNIEKGRQYVDWTDGIREIRKQIRVWQGIKWKN